MTVEEYWAIHGDEEQAGRSRPADYGGGLAQAPADGDEATYMTKYAGLDRAGWLLLESDWSDGGIVHVGMKVESTRKRGRA